MFAREELRRLQARKEELLNEVERDRKAVRVAVDEACDGLRGIQHIGRLVRSAVQWRALILPVALLVMPRKVRNLIRVVSEASKAFHLGKAIIALWRREPRNSPSQEQPTGLA